MANERDNEELGAEGSNAGQQPTGQQATGQQGQQSEFGRWPRL